ncbi:MAG: RNA pseudouridine synthase, partial [Pseudomonadota bacterium]|nr:RNA pseudouridine synthase [Pseudomonadota bacterium]
ESTRLRLEPITGRSHQLRVHMAEIGHAILGDSFYASPAGLAAAQRLLLHASRLSLRHPLSGDPLTFEAPCPF